MNENMKKKQKIQTMLTMYVVGDRLPLMINNKIFKNISQFIVKYLMICFFEQLINKLTGANFLS